MKNLSRIVLFAISLNVHSQSTPWLWAKSAGGTGWDFANSIATDAAGNVYVAGYFESNTMTIGTTTLTNSGTTSSSGSKGYDIFLAKYDNSGNVMWAKSAVSSGLDSGIIGGGGRGSFKVG